MKTTTEAPPPDSSGSPAGSAIADYWLRVRMIYRLKRLLGWKAWRLPPGLGASPGEILRVLGEGIFVLTFPVWWVLRLLLTPVEPFMTAIFRDTDQVRRAVEKWERDLSQNDRAVTVASPNQKPSNETNT